MKKLDNKGWKKVRFGEVCRNLNVTIKSPEQNGYDKVIGLENIESGSLHIKTWGDLADGTTFTKTFEPGHVLFGKRRAYLKKAALAEFKGLCSGDILVFEAITKVLHPKLLPFIVSSDRFFEYAVKTSAGSLSPRTKFQDLANFEFSLPSIDQQEKLAELLWAGENVANSYKIILNKKYSLINSFVSDYFNFRELNKEWKMEKLSNLFEIRRGASPRPINDPRFFSDSGRGWVRISDVTSQNKYLNNTEQFLSREGENNSVAVNKGDVIMSICATIGRPMIINSPSCIHDGFVLFRAKDGIEVDSEYLYYILKYFEKYFESKRQMGTQGNLNTTIVGNVLIPFSKIEFQFQFTNRMKLIDDLFSSSEKSLSHFVNLKMKIINQVFQ